MKPLQATDPARIGRYDLEGTLGAGGMGTVYLGRSPGGRPAAIKVVNPAYLSYPEALARFRREAEMLGTVRSAYTATLIDCELTAPPYWMATEYIPGPTLAATVGEDGPMSPRWSLRLMAALAEGLSDIHKHGICHRDLKPQNVILSSTGPQLIDFGIARSLGQSGLTMTGITMGTPGYIAPELMVTDELTPAADVFALGATITHAATARRPYGTGTLENIYLRLVQEDIDLQDVDPDLADLIRACVVKEPTWRPGPEEIITWCRDLLDGTAPDRRRPPQAAPPQAAPAAAPPGPGSTLPPGPGSTLPPGHPGSTPPPGHAGLPPGHAGLPPGHAGLPPGHAGSTPPPGHAGLPPGHAGFASPAGFAASSSPPGHGTSSPRAAFVSSAAPPGSAVGDNATKYPDQSAYLGTTMVRPPGSPAAAGTEGSARAAMPAVGGWPPLPPGDHPPAGRRRSRLLAVTAAAFVAMVLFAGGALVALHFSARDNREAAESTPFSPADSIQNQSSTTPAPTTPAAGPVAVPSTPSGSRSKATKKPTATTRTPTSPTVAANEPTVKTPTSGDGRCIQMPVDKNGAQVSAARCDGSKAQFWTFTKEGALKDAASTRCLDIGGNAGADIKFRVQIWDCNLGDAQIWVPEPDGTLFNTRSGRCLSILPTADGGPALAILTCVATANQRWKLPS